MEYLENKETILLVISRLFFKLLNGQNLEEIKHQIQEFWENRSLNQIEQQLAYQADHLESEFLAFIKQNHQIHLSPAQSPNKQITTVSKERIYMDGCFDLIHPGHFNAVRQAKQLGMFLVVGVHSDTDIAKNKGHPVIPELERYSMVRACKWVDEVVEGAPFDTSPEYLDSINCWYVAHGDDISLNAQGVDSLSEMKKINRVKLFKRTEGVSTTCIMGKLLLMTKKNLPNEAIMAEEQPLSVQTYIQQKASSPTFLPTTLRLSLFSNKREPQPGDKIVYVDGCFDLLHAGHVEALKLAKKLGTFLYVGVHDDQTCNLIRGSFYPILPLHERVLCLLALRDVDEIIMGAPWKITEDLIKTFGIQIVAHVVLEKPFQSKKVRKISVEYSDEVDPYHIPKKIGIYEKITCEHELDSNVILQRIMENRINFSAKFDKKSTSEEQYYQNKQFITEVNATEVNPKIL